MVASDAPMRSPAATSDEQTESGDNDNENEDSSEQVAPGKNVTKNDPIDYHAMSKETAEMIKESQATKAWLENAAV
uniref:Nucleotide exchange factor GrpE n=1 Tax=Panagrellus redivivus TaxID=6233 RepID=A0A7E4V3X3_PANRE